MTSAKSLACPNCQRTLHALEWIDAGSCRCRSCLGEFMFVPFPALTQKEEVAKPQAVVVADESTCFFHAENQAEKVCDTCGRFVCAVCAIPAGAKTHCPTCMSTTRVAGQGTGGDRTLWDGVALALATLPILMWPFTIVTAPAAIVVAIMGRKKPKSLVRPRAWRSVVAIMLGAVQTAAWIVGITYLIVS